MYQGESETILRKTVCAACSLMALVSAVHADIALMINHQGLVKVNSLPFTGNGQFKFGFVDGASSSWLWTNDGSHLGQLANTQFPDSAVTLPVNNGIYNVRLGDTAFINMVVIPSSVFNSSDVKLRVVFNDGVNGWQLLSPDQPVTASAYAYHAATADLLQGKSAADLSVPSGYSLLGASTTAPAGYTYSGRSFGGTWSSGANMPTARAGALAVWSNNLFYVIGGSYLATNEAYDVSSNIWSTKAQMPTGRENMAGGAVNGIIYVMGGLVSTPAAIATNEAYDTASNTWSTKAPMPTARRECAAAVVNGIIYVFGGRNGYPGSIIATNEAYDPASNTWSTKMPMSTARYSVGVAVVNGIIYAIGGISISGTVTTNEAYDPVTNAWTTKAPMPTGRHGLAALGLGGRIYAVGGSTDVGDSVTGVNEFYDPGTNSWTTDPMARTARDYMGYASNGSVACIFGGYAPSSILGLTEVYTSPLFVHVKN